MREVLSPFYREKLRLERVTCSRPQARVCWSQSYFQRGVVLLLLLGPMV